MQQASQQLWCNQNQQAMMNQRAMASSIHSSAAALGNTALAPVQPSHLLLTQSVSPHLPVSHQQPAAQIETEAPNLTLHDIGTRFATHYFKIMKTNPRDLPLFYSDDSYIQRTTRRANGDTMIFDKGAGSVQIAQLLYKVHASGQPLAKILIRVMHCQGVFCHGILIHIYGTLGFVDNTCQNFSMTTLLMPQNRPSFAGYYISNDSFIEMDAPHLVTAENIPSTEPTSVAPGLPASSYKNVSPKSPSAFIHPRHPSSKPAIPTTPAASQVKPDLSTASTNYSVPQQMSAVSNPQDFQASQTTPAKQADSSAEFYVESSDDIDDDEEEPVQEIPAPRSVAQQAQSNLETPVEPAAPARAVAQQTVHQPSKPVQQSVQQQSPQQPVQEPQQPMQQSVQLQENTVNKQQPDTTSTVRSASKYPKNSYAGVLLAAGTLPIPCQVGYSVPGNERPKPVEPTVRRSPAPRARSVNKTLWIPQIPQDVSDEKIKLDLANHLKSRYVEGYVVRIDRQPDQLHGYIELDTESSAELLVAEGFLIHGQQIQAQFANNGRNKRRPGSRKDQSSPGLQQQRKSSQRFRADTTRQQQRPPTDDGWLHTSSRRRTKQSSGGQPRSSRQPRQSRQSPSSSGGQKKNSFQARSRRLQEESVMNLAQPVN